MQLATALVGTGNGGLRLYRGIRDSSRTDGYQFWAVNPDYAAQYGSDVLEAELIDDSLILDLRECVDSSGDYAGWRIDEECHGLADAMGIDLDATIERDRLWDCCTDSHANAVALVRREGYAGWRWLEGDEDTFCLFV